MKYFLTMLLFTAIICISVNAQKTVVEVPDYWETQQEGTLNTAVNAAISAGTLSNTVFKLKTYGTYILDGSIITPAGQELEIVADDPGATQETAPPMICWTASTAPSKTYMFDVAGKIKMKNIWLLWASLDGTRYTSTIRVGDSATVAGGRCEFENVTFDYVQQASSGAIQPFATHFVGKFKNCYFRNCTDDHFRYYSRAVSAAYGQTGIHIDTLTFENCTFANIGYVYMQEAGIYGDNVHFNHCTFYNVMMFTLESGWWYKMSVTNSMFVNTYAFGRIPQSDGEGFGGTINIAPIDTSASLGAGFGFEVPFTEQDRRILFANNNYFTEQWLVDWMGYGPNGSPYSKAQHKARHDEAVPTPQPMINGNTRAFFDSIDVNTGKKVFPYMNQAANDSLDPAFVNAPVNLDSIKLFLNKKWDDNSDIRWAWQPWLGYSQKWPFVESLSYTNETLKTAAMGQYPIGDIYHWFPEKYTDWNNSYAAKERSDLAYWIENGLHPDSVLNNVKTLPGLPKQYVLNQNYPNPFNPTTKIQYSIPVAGHVTINVYNSLGQLVGTIFSGNQKAGNYSVDFNASGLASGVYMYQLQSGSVSMTKKFILAK